MFDDEKAKKQQDIQSAIERLNISNGEKEALRKELDTLTHDQRTL